MTLRLQRFVCLHLVLAVLACRLFEHKVSGDKCNYFEGSWVHDDSFPLYDSNSCPFITKAFDCLKNGRPDHDYLKYRWQPTTCDIPRFNGVDFMERNRGKKIMFVGDSLSNNIWVSLTCLLHAAEPKANYTIGRKEDAVNFYIAEYDISILYLRNGFIVDVVNESIGRVLKLDSISTAKQWLGVDTLVFNTYHWWFHTGQLQKWDYIRVGDKVVKDMDRFEALKIALTTWANWVDKNIDPARTRVFFQGAAAVHFNPSEWNDPDPKARTCIGQKQPVEGPKYPGTPIKGETIMQEVISKMKRPAYFLDIALLTQLRKDGHPSLYAGGGIKFNDCSHWCLPGAPDTWNQLLYAALLGN